MSNQLQPEKLQRVLSFYQTQADAMAANVRSLNAKLNSILHVDLQIRNEIERTQTIGTQLATSAANLQLTHQRLEQLTDRQKEIHIQLQAAQAELDGQRKQLIELKGKIESMEKLIEKVVGSMANERRKRDQHQADERYLNTHFSGSPQ